MVEKIVEGRQGKAVTLAGLMEGVEGACTKHVGPKSARAEVQSTTVAAMQNPISRRSTSESTVPVQLTVDSVRPCLGGLLHL